MSIFIKDDNSKNKITKNLLICLIPLIIFSIYKNGYLPFKEDKISMFQLLYPLILVIVSILSMLLTTFVYSKITKKSFKNNLNFIYPVIFCLMLSINTPIYLVIIGSIIITILDKLLPRKLKFINCTLIVGLMVILINTLLNNSYLNPLETNLVNISNINNIGNYETLVRPYGNLLDFFVGFIPGILGGSSILCLIGFIYLCFTKSIKWRITVVYILIVLAMTFYIGNISGFGLWYPLYNVFTCGLLFGAIYLSALSSSPITPIGQWLYGIFLGIVTVILRYFMPIEECVLISILIVNLFGFLFDKIGCKSRFNLNKCLIAFVIAWFLIIGFEFYITKKIDNNLIIEGNNSDVITP